VSRLQDKAETLALAWQSLFGAAPSFVAMVNAMAVAELETRMGDAWPGENNWGAVMKRGLSAPESETLRASGIAPSGGAPALAAARALLVPGANESLHRDSSPGRGPFFAWFWSFPTAAQAAKKFLEVLVGGRSGVRAIIDQASPDELARAMFASHYYEGFHKDDPEANIRDYATAIRRARAAIETGLRASTPNAPPQAPPVGPSPSAGGQGSSSFAGAGFAALAVLGVIVVTRGRRAA